MAMKKRKQVERQDWKFPVLIRMLRTGLKAAFSLVKIALGGVATVLLVAVVCCFVLVGAAGDYLQDDIIPSISFDEEDFSLDQTSFIHCVDSDGQIRLYQQIYTDTDRQWAALEDIPEALVHAAVAIEDKRFYEHQGVDWITTVKACANMFFGSSSTFGGSTITQQLVKNLTGDKSVTVQRKVEEIFRAQKYEETNDKDTIMEWYLNTIYFGNLKFGVKSAAQYYFGKDLEELTTAECASLIAITNNPSLYNPYTRPENNRKRQENVLWAMKEQGWLTEAAYEEALAQEMVFTKGSAEDSKEIYTCECGFADIARNYDRDGTKFLCPSCGAEMDIELDSSSDMYSWFTEMVLDDVAEDLCKQHGEEWNKSTKDKYLTLIKKSGYHIYCTIDTDVQKAIDEIYTDLDNIPTTKSAQQLLSAIVVIDNRTGDIVGVAGSVGEKEYFDATNHATYDDPKQTGSATKPLIVYAPAFETGNFSPTTVLPDLPLTYDGGRFPNNVNRRYSISNSIYTGIEDSMNTIAVYTLDKIGLKYAFEFARDKFRLTGLLESEPTESGFVRSDIGYSPLALGALTYGVSVREMATAYATFPNGGQWREARTYTKVYDSEGNLVLDNTQEHEQILSERTVNYINYCLRGVVSSGSASRHTQLGSTQAAGKTGSTSSNRDRWFCGYTSYYTAAVWCGYKQPEEIKLTGSDTTNPSSRLWGKVMKLLHEDVEYRNVADVSGMSSYSVCVDSGKNATDACRADTRDNRVQSIRCYSDDAPRGSCDLHITVDWCTEGDGAANEFCHLAGANIAPHALVKYTQAKLDEIERAGRVDDFADNTIYLVDKSGNPVNSFHGLDGDINAGINAPYKVCTVHTAATVLPPETEPSVPAPTDPVNPGTPVTPEPPANPAAVDSAE